MGDSDSGEGGGATPVRSKTNPSQVAPVNPKKQPDGGGVFVMDAESINGDGVDCGGNLGGLNGQPAVIASMISLVIMEKNIENVMEELRMEEYTSQLSRNK